MSVKDFGTATITVTYTEGDRKVQKFVTIKLDRPTSDLKVNRHTNESVYPLIEGFEEKWNISSKYGWSVYSPDAGIIKVTDYGHNVRST